MVGPLKNQWDVLLLLLLLLLRLLVLVVRRTCVGKVRPAAKILAAAMSIIFLNISVWSTVYGLISSSITCSVHGESYLHYLSSSIQVSFHPSCSPKASWRFRISSTGCRLCLRRTWSRPLCRNLSNQLSDLAICWYRTYANLLNSSFLNASKPSNFSRCQYVLLSNQYIWIRCI